MQARTLYNFEVENTHTHFVGSNGFWVHNQCARFANSFTSFPEATLPVDSPQLDALVSQPPWEDAAPPAPVPSALEKAARDFLLDPALAPSALVTNRAPVQNIRGVDRGARVWPLDHADGSKGGLEALLALDPRTRQVLAFSAPPPRPPLPESILSPGQAREAALQWARRHFARAGAPAAEEASSVEAELTAAGRYVVRWKAAAEPSEWLIEVEAHSGKVAGLRRAPTPPQVLGAGTSSTLGASPRASQRMLFADRLPRFSPDGARLAWLSNRPRAGAPAWWAGRPFALWAANADGSGARVLLDEADPTQAPAWSADGRLVAVRSASGARAGAILVADAQTPQVLEVPAPSDPGITATLLGWSGPREVLLLWAHNGPGTGDLMAWSVDEPSKAPRLLASRWSDRMGPEWGHRAALLSRDQSTFWALWSVPEEKAPTRSCAADLWAWSPRDWKQAPRRVASCLPWGSSLQEQGGSLSLGGPEGALEISVGSGQATPWAWGQRLLPPGSALSGLDVALAPSPSAEAAFVLPREAASSVGGPKALALHRVAPDGQASPLLSIAP